MANKQINELSELTNPVSGDLIPIYDLDEAGSEKTKKIIVERFQWTYTAQTATTAGTSITLTSSIPSWATEIEIFLNGISTNGTSRPLIRIGDSGGVETAGYECAVGRETDSQANVTDGFPLEAASHSAAHIINGVITLKRWDSSEFLWFGSGILNKDGLDAPRYMSGRKATDSAVTTIVLTTSGGTNTLDAGEARVRYR